MLLVVVSGLALGGLYGMTALVYNVMYSTSKVLSFGTGQFAMVGGICTAWLVLDLHLADLGRFHRLPGSAEPCSAG